MKTLFNIYIVFFFLLLGPEAIAKSLPMKRVQTVETVWVPMEEADQETVIEEQGEIKSVEIPENTQEAVPLFKEAVSEEPPSMEAEEEVKIVKSEDIPDLQIKTPNAKEGQQPPVIQVIYQGYDSKKKEEKKELPKVVEREAEVPPEDFKVIKEQVEKLIKEKGKKKGKEGGDIYNFYFRS